MELRKDVVQQIHTIIAQAQEKPFNDQLTVFLFVIGIQLPTELLIL